MKIKPMKSMATPITIIENKKASVGLDVSFLLKIHVIVKNGIVTMIWAICQSNEFVKYILTALEVGTPCVLIQKSAYGSDIKFDGDTADMKQLVIEKIM